MDKKDGWNDGKTLSIVFVERLEELAYTYEVSKSSMPELLRGEALTWFRNNNGSWSHCDAFKVDFIKFFLQANSSECLEDDN